MKAIREESILKIPTEDLIKICQDRLKALQKGNLCSNENAQALYHLNLALKYLTGKEVNFGGN